jgi:hypothetical protein
VVQQYQEKQTVSHEQVKDAFEDLLPEFQNPGSRYTHYLTAFSGRDLLWAMDESMQAIGFEGAMTFREKVLKGIAQTAEDIADWLPEWRRLRELIDQV